MQAVCPKCRCQLPQIGYRCENDGWYGVDISELDYPDTVVGRPLAGAFYALRRIGQGGMGTVYEGRQIQFNRVVAIKVLSTAHLSDEQVFARFEREARSIARVNHPNVVKLIDSGFEAGNSIAYIVMEYVKGIELSNIPASELSGQFIAHIAYQVLNALAEAHAMNVIHRDLKPDNIMITNENGDPHFVKVLDFGLAALTDRAKITMSGQALGTPWYMSPEQATASAVSFSSDIYSLGCILYELATSKPPFPGNRPFNVMMQHVNAQVPPMITRPEAEISADMVGFILRCLEKQPQNRYQTANEALSALYMLPEWMVDGQSTPSQSLLQSMRQLSQLSDIRSDISSSITGILRSGEIIVRSDEISVRSGEVISRPSDPAVRSGRSFSLNIQGLTESGSHPRQSRQFHSESIVQSLISSSPENPKVNSQELAYISDPDGRLASMESFVGEKFKFIVAIAIVIIAALIVAIIYLATRGA